VALPHQLYVETHSAFLVGLLGAVELGPLITRWRYDAAQWTGGDEQAQQTVAVN
jgi:hypothetical protein